MEGTYFRGPLKFSQTPLNLHRRLQAENAHAPAAQSKHCLSNRQQPCTSTAFHSLAHDIVSSFLSSYYPFLRVSPRTTKSLTALCAFTASTNPRKYFRWWPTGLIILERSGTACSLQIETSVQPAYNYKHLREATIAPLVTKILRPAVEVSCSS